MVARARCILLSITLLACGGQCGHPGPAPDRPPVGEDDSQVDGNAVVEVSIVELGGDGGSEPVADVADAAGEADIPSDATDATPVEPLGEPLFDEQEALAALKFKKVPKIPKFKPSGAQDVADPEELSYLTDHEKTCKLLADAPWAQVQGEKTLVPMKRVRINDGISYRFRILIGEKEGEIITGFFKPRQANYWDWLKEYHAYNVGRLIDAPTVPLVMRFMSKNKFNGFLAKITQEEKDNFKWEGPASDQIRGVFKYWVPSYRHRTFGARVIDETYMTEIAASLHPVNKKKLREQHDLYLQLGRGIVFDYLTLNEDRPENLGTILMPDGSYHIVLIDNGLSLGVEHKGRTVMKDMFEQMTIYPQDMIEKVKLLEKGQIEGMFRPEDDSVMWLPEVIVEQFWKRRNHILDQIEKNHQKFGDVIWY